MQLSLWFVLCCQLYYLWYVLLASKDKKVSVKSKCNDICKIVHLIFLYDEMTDKFVYYIERRNPDLYDLSEGITFLNNMDPVSGRSLNEWVWLPIIYVTVNISGFVIRYLQGLITIS